MPCTEECYLRWAPRARDERMGLNHQFASLSCALSEAISLRRTFVLPSRLCLNEKHAERWSPSTGCVPIEDLVDVAGLSRFIPVTTNPGCFAKIKPLLVNKTWSTTRVRDELPCSAAFPLIQRSVGDFWYRECLRRQRGVIDTQTLNEHVLRHIELAPPQAGAGRSPPPISDVMHLLRSGLFYSQTIKRAAIAVRRRRPI